MFILPAAKLLQSLAVQEEDLHEAFSDYGEIKVWVVLWGSHLGHALSRDHVQGDGACCM